MLRLRAYVVDNLWREQQKQGLIVMQEKKIEANEMIGIFFLLKTLTAKTKLTLWGLMLKGFSS